MNRQRRRESQGASEGGGHLRTLVQNDREEKSTIFPTYVVKGDELISTCNIAKEEEKISEDEIDNLLYLRRLPIKR